VKVKGKPWTVEEEKYLRALVEAGESLKEISLKMNKTKQSVRRKIERLGLEVVGHKPVDSCPTSSNVVLPEKMMCADDVLKTLRGLTFRNIRRVYETLRKG